MFIIKEKGGINMINVNKVGEFITLKRKEKGLTQQQLANKLSVSFQAVSKWKMVVCLMLRYYQIWPHY